MCFSNSLRSKSIHQYCFVVCLTSLPSFFFVEIFTSFCYYWRVVYGKFTVCFRARSQYSGIRFAVESSQLVRFLRLRSKSLKRFHFVLKLQKTLNYDRIDVEIYFKHERIMFSIDFPSISIHEKGKKTFLRISKCKFLAFQFHFLHISLPTQMKVNNSHE